MFKVQEIIQYALELDDLKRESCTFYFTLIKSKIIYKMKKSFNIVSKENDVLKVITMPYSNTNLSIARKLHAQKKYDKLDVQTELVMFQTWIDPFQVRDIFNLLLALRDDKRIAVVETEKTTTVLH